MPSNAIILAIETATSCCSAAIYADGQVIQRSAVGSNIHSKVLLSMVRELVIEANVALEQIAAIAVGQGPGSFTGLRIGVGVAQGLAYGLDRPMIGVSSLDALALQADVDGHVIAAIDARMGEAYWAQYTLLGGRVKRDGDICVTPPGEIEVPQGSVLVGNAWQEYWSQTNRSVQASRRLDDVIYPDAAALLALARRAFSRGESIAAVEFAPIYVRNNVAKKAKPR